MDEASSTSFLKRNADFVSLTSAIATVEGTSLDSIEKLSSAYESLLLHFPLCYGYWTRYAHHMGRLHEYNKAVLVYERAVKAATYSVDLWTSYCCFAMEFYEDPDDVRRVYERALSFIGKDYLCSIIWDKYLEFELANRELIRLAQLYLRILRFPSKKLHLYYERFKKLVSIVEEEMKLQNDGYTEDAFDETLDWNVEKHAKVSEITRILLDQPSALLTPAVFKRYLLTGEYLYEKSCMLNKRIACFETGIKRTYFHVHLLDEGQLVNWHNYLDFVEKEGDLDWTVKLYERCLIPCANNQEFWIRYADHLEANGGREIAKNAIERALKVFLKGDASFHLYSVRFMERTGDIISARSSLSSWEFVSDPDFLQCVTSNANMEKRLGNIEEAYQVYEKAILIVEEKHDLHTLSLLYFHFARFKFMVTGSTDAAREIFLEGLRKIPYDKYLIEALMQFFILHGGTSQIHILDSLVERVLHSDGGITSTLSIDDRKDISCLFIEFVDLHGTIHDVEKAWHRHMKLFPHLIRHAALEVNNIQEKDIVPWSNIKVRCSASDLHNAEDDGFGLSDEDLPVQCAGTETNMDERGHHTFTSNRHGGSLSKDIENNPNVEAIEHPREPAGFIVKENTLPDGLDDMSETSKRISEGMCCVSIDSPKGIDPPILEALAIDSSGDKKIKSKTTSGQDQDDSFGNIFNPSSFEQEQMNSNVSSKTCARSDSAHVQNNTRSSPDHIQNNTRSSPDHIHNNTGSSPDHIQNNTGLSPDRIQNNTGLSPDHIQNNTGLSPDHVQNRTGLSPDPIQNNTRLSPDENPPILEQVEMEGVHSQLNVPNETTASHNASSRANSLAISNSGQTFVPANVTQSLQISTVQNPGNLQIHGPRGHLPQEQAGNEKLLQHAHGYLLPSQGQNYAKQGVSSSSASAAQTGPSQAVHSQSNEAYQHQHQQQISQQLWYYYQQQMYYAQLQQCNLQMQMQYMKNEQPVWTQQNSPHLQMPDAREQSNQTPNTQQTVQQLYQQQHVLQNYLYQQYNQMSTQVQIPTHPQSSQQHHGHRQSFGDQQLQQQQQLLPQQLPMYHPLQRDHKIDHQHLHQNQLVTPSEPHLHSNIQPQACTHGNNLQICQVDQQAISTEVSEQGRSSPGRL